MESGMLPLVAERGVPDAADTDVDCKQSFKPEWKNYVLVKINLAKHT